MRSMRRGSRRRTGMANLLRADKREGRAFGRPVNAGPRRSSCGWEFGEPADSVKDAIGQFARTPVASGWLWHRLCRHERPPFETGAGRALLRMRLASSRFGIPSDARGCAARATLSLPVPLLEDGAWPEPPIFFELRARTGPEDRSWPGREWRSILNGRHSQDGGRPHEHGQKGD